jgi:hypothetical protein
MHWIFQNFIDCLSSASNSDALRDAMSQAAAGLDLSCFAYLSTPDKTGGRAVLISNYPSAWTTHYLQRHYERSDQFALGRPSHLGSPTLFHHDTLACFTRINEKDPVFSFKPISNGLVDFSSSRIGSLCIVDLDTNDRPPRDAYEFSQLRLF